MKGPFEVASNETELPRSRRLFIHDPKTDLRFMIDSGADVSVIPRKKEKTPDKFKLYAANGTPISMYSTRNLRLNLGS